MSETKHTPGRNPLEVQFAEMRRQLEGYIQAFDCINEAMGFAHRAISDPDSIAVVDLPTETKDVNALLIAAAPELLESLECLTAVLALKPKELSLQAIQEAYDLARAAIAKAKGEQP